MVEISNFDRAQIAYVAQRHRELQKSISSLCRRALDEEIQKCKTPEDGYALLTEVLKISGVQNPIDLEPTLRAILVNVIQSLELGILPKED